MQSGRLLAIISLIAPLTLPRITNAQGSSGAQLFSAYDNSFPGGTLLAGFGLAVGAGPLALRGSFGLSMSTFSSLSATGTTAPNAGRWSGDVDLILGNDLLGLLQLFGGAVHPYGFAGLGAHSATSSPTVADAVKTWSYGGGVAIPLWSNASLQGEMRNRSTIGSSAINPTDFVNGQEFRLGIDLKLGGGKGTSGARGVGLPSSRTTWPAGTAGASGAARRVVPRGEKFLGTCTTTRASTFRVRHGRWPGPASRSIADRWPSGISCCSPRTGASAMSRSTPATETSSIPRRAEMASATTI
jgi:hypothetical protein